MKTQSETDVILGARFYHRMTQNQRDVFDQTLSEAQVEFAHCIERWTAAHAAANIPLGGLTPEGGKVTHGGRNDCRIVEIYWKQRFDAVKVFLEPDWVRAHTPDGLGFM